MAESKVGRPTKQGLDFFPLDTSFDDEVEYIEAKYGSDGICVFVKLLQRVYRSGFWCKWAEKEQYLFANSVVKIDISAVKNIVSDCINEGLFDENLYFRYQILTSKGIQRRYFYSVGKRTSVKIVKQFLLVEVPKTINTEEIDVSDTKIGISTGKNPTNKNKHENKNIKTNNNTNYADKKSADFKPYEKFAFEIYPELFKKHTEVIPKQNKQKDKGYSGAVDKYLKQMYPKDSDEEILGKQKTLYEYFCNWIQKEPWINGRKVDAPLISRFAENIETILKDYLEVMASEQKNKEQGQSADRFLAIGN